MSHHAEVNALVIRELVDLACSMCEDENLTGLRSVLAKLKPRVDALANNLVKEERSEENVGDKSKKHK